MCWRSGQNSLWYDLRIDEPVMVSMDHLVKCSEESFRVWKQETPHKTSGMWRESLSWILLKKLHNCVIFSKSYFVYEYRYMCHRVIHEDMNTQLEGG